MKIGFFVKHFTFRGTETVLMQYAYYNQTILNNQSVIITTKQKHPFSLPEVEEQFKKVFKRIIYIDNIQEIKQLYDNRIIDAIYFIKRGEKDEYWIDGMPNLIHCVFTTSEPHGNVYAGVSPLVANQKFPYVEHIIELQEYNVDYRKFLNIPQDALVIGRHGGHDTFNLEYVKDAMFELLNERNDIYFILAVKPQMFYGEQRTHDRLIFCEPFFDPKIKRTFLNTCDLMLHASNHGETFGISILEFCYLNKGIIFDPNGEYQQYTRYLGDKGHKYINKTQLKFIINKFKRKNNQLYYENKMYDPKTKEIASRFTPENIMKDFERVFLKDIKRM